jgi:UDP-N-acetylmuramyl tripeptide synthase
MQQRVITMLGKGVRQLALLRGGGSALPGLFVERIDPRFIQRTLETLPRGIVIVSGTNGKTTTTKMVVELLESQGMKVFTNRTGSNFTRGVAAALLGEVDNDGKLDADIAVLELDEAHAVHFVRAIKPHYSLLLNVMRDQLDRFGEIDTTAKLLHTIAHATTKGIVINRDDPRLGNPLFTKDLSAEVYRYGVASSLLSQFPSDDNMRDPTIVAMNKTAHSDDDDTVLESFSGQSATIRFNGASHDVSLKLRGIYNVQNAVGAIALTRLVMNEEIDDGAMLAALAEVTPAFGRGETVMVDGTPCELVLVKNPSGFRLSLASFAPDGYATMIAINDDYADGRDMSWLWDVDFESLKNEGVRMVSGVRAYDMALRLQYDEVELSEVETNLSDALNLFLSKQNDRPKRIYCTYTAMLAIRRLLAKKATVETVR